MMVGKFRLKEFKEFRSFLMKFVVFIFAEYLQEFEG